MATIPAKRSRTLVDSEVQGSLVRRVALHWIVFFVCNTIALTFWIRLFEQPDADWGQTFGDTVRRFLPFFVITAALIPAFVWDTLKLSHRFAGPILRLRNTLKDIKAGRAVAPLKFRDNDFWQEMASHFNDVMRLRDADGPTGPGGSEIEPAGREVSDG
ncbi:hypothetical protein Enr13x_19760 [Stieleria neptunia]|uniref:HAMP domain-containing protein n=1 Tax=Stieleria neptunia TaxID=2527979 RepID=A0A518HMQ5_9BACT|nr:hypothetical protein [Stieleria neptunia]QDV42133.1 hypothetical protein Enr13x_19760 [Stieleria neptunia]